MCVNWRASDYNWTSLPTLAYALADEKKMEAARKVAEEALKVFESLTSEEVVKI